MSCSNINTKTINNEKCRVVVGVKVEESVRSVVGVKIPVYVPSLEAYVTSEELDNKLDLKLDKSKLTDAVE